MKQKLDINRHAAKLLLAALMLAMGCTQSSPLTGGQSGGVSAIRFEPDLKEVQEGGKVVLALLAQNVGFFEAKNVNANLFMYDGFEFVGEPPKSADVPNLKSINTELNTPGGTSEVLWTLKAPKISSGELNYPFNFILDLSYDYESSGFLTVPILKYERVLQLKQDNKPLPKGQEHYLNGPLGISIKADNPIIIKDNDKTFILKVVLTLNDGYIKEKNAVSGDCGSNLQNAEMDKLNCVRSVDIELPETLLSTVAGNDADGDPNCAFTNGNKQNVKLVEGKEVVLSCKLNVLGDADEMNPTIKIKTNYRHHVRAEAPITVIK